MQDESSSFMVICLRAATCDKVGDVSKLSFLGMVKASNPFLNFGRGQWGSTTYVGMVKRERDEAANARIQHMQRTRVSVYFVFTKPSWQSDICP